MTRLVSLMDFDAKDPVHRGAASQAQTVLDEARLASFEEGYSAGWEDACRAHDEDQTRISSAFGQRLQELSFTYHEAQAALVQDLEDLLLGLVDVVLPAARGEGLAAMIKDRALAVGAEQGTVVEVLVAPEHVERVEALADEKPAPPMRVVGEPTLSAGQACLRFGAAEERIDLDAALAQIRDAVADFSRDGPPADATPSKGAEECSARAPEEDAPDARRAALSADWGADGPDGRPSGARASSEPHATEASAAPLAGPTKEEERRRA